MAFLAFVQALLAWTFGILHPAVGLSEGLALRSLPISPHPQKKRKKHCQVANLSIAGPLGIYQGEFAHILGRLVALPEENSEEDMEI